MQTKYLSFLAAGLYAGTGIIFFTQADDDTVLYNLLGGAFCFLGSMVGGLAIFQPEGYDEATGNFYPNFHLANSSVFFGNAIMAIAKETLDDEHHTAGRREAAVGGFFSIYGVLHMVRTARDACKRYNDNRRAIADLEQPAPIAGAHGP